jgi:hypothetical protein
VVSQEAQSQAEDGQASEDFVPRGAIAFMAFLIAVYAAVWLFVYALVLTRP